jgi:hypothetical protein
MLFLRYGLPGLICLVGVVVGLSLNNSEQGLEVAILLIAAGSSLWLMNILMRVGISGDRERDEEDAARRFFDEHGYWPDERDQGAKRSSTQRPPSRR